EPGSDSQIAEFCSALMPRVDTHGTGLLPSNKLLTSHSHIGPSRRAVAQDMLDGVSLDQLRAFIAAADEGSFSAAGRRLRRAQSVVSQTLANLEGRLGVKLFDRGARLPMLTEQGRALLADARAVAGNVDLFKARAKSLAGGLEPELGVAVDVVF